MSLESTPEGGMQGAGEFGATSALDPLSVVRRHPEWFFEGGVFDVDELIDMLTSEALRSGASTIRVDRREGWVIVEADKDWLDGELAPFVAPVSYPGGGRNSTRVEVALTAFCRAVETVAGDVRYQAVPPPPDTPLPGSVGTSRGRLIAFLPPPAAAALDQHDAEGRVARTERHLRLIPGEGEQRIRSAVHSFMAKQRALRA